MEDEYSFYIFYLLPWKKMFSVKISFVPRGRQAFFLHFLASSTGEEYSFYILLFSAMVEDLLAKTAWRQLMPCMRELCKTTAADLPSDCTQVALDSSRLKSTGDQGKNWTSQHQNRSFTNIIRDIALDGCLFSCQNSIIKSKNKEKIWQYQKIFIPLPRI